MNCLIVMRYRLVIYIFLFAFFSCSAADDFEVIEKGERTSKNNRACNILIIGNSLARDAYCYVPVIMEEICPELAVNMDIMYVSGKPLQAHWNYIHTDSNKFTWDTYSTEQGKWTTSSSWNASEIISNQKWDLIVFQEGSVNARTYESTQPYVSNIIKYIKTFQDSVMYAYTIIPSLPDGASSIKNTTSDNIWVMNATTSKRLLDEGIVSYLVPCGTAIQNARHSRLDDYGDFGHLTYDGRHLQEGIPCVVDAYAATEALLRILGMESSIENSYLRVTNSWVSVINVLGRHGAVIEGSEDDYFLAKRCALLAMDHPYELSEIGY